MENNTYNNLASNFRLKATIVELPNYEERSCKDVDVNVFFPNEITSAGRRKALMEAAAICASCVVREECLEAAIANDEKDGFFGGVDFYKSLRTRARINSRNKNKTDII